VSKPVVLNDRRSLIFTACAFLLGGLIALAAMSLAAASQEDEVVARVNGEPISRGEFFERLQEVAGEQILDQIILEKLIAQAGRRPEAAVSDEEVQAELEAIKESFGSEEAFEAELNRYQLTLERLLYEIRLNMILTKLSREGVTVTDQEIAEFFEANKEQLGTPEQLKVRHILVETREVAEEILDALKAGADFAELARARSLDTASGLQGGEIGYIRRDSPIVDEFKEAAFRLGAGDLSEPVQSPFGWHIIRVDERIEAEEATLETAGKWIREYLADQKAKPVEQVFQELRSGAEIEVMWPRYRSLGTSSQ